MIWLREFSWRYFTLTGDIHAYLLYKKHQEREQDAEELNSEADTIEPSME
jgi:hypothetical protein